MTTIINSKLTDNALTILEKRYFLKDNNGNIIEDAYELFNRVAITLANVEAQYGAVEEDVEGWRQKFFDIMWNLDFLPNSPTLMNAGTGQGTLSGCYVLNIVDSMVGIMSAATDQAMVEKFGGGIGFSLSDIRPKGLPISTTQGKSCGPIEVLKVLSQVGTMITQGGRRDGAHMAILDCFHPDIEEFIHCKNIEGDIHNFNISVGADSNFMNAVQEDKYIHLTWPIDRNIYDIAGTGDGRHIKARDLFQQIISGAWKNGEPGMIWLDYINQDNTTPNIGEIKATNPCGEQPLLSGESCNLGSINVGNFIKNGEFDIARFRDVIRITVRFLDNVVDTNNHPTELTCHMNKTTRKIGLGIMGFADLLVRLGIPYDSDDALNVAELIAKELKSVADMTSASIGAEKGSFPAFEDSTLNINNGGAWHTMRNAWRLSIAPSGTISMIAGCSSGIEPLFSLAYKKHNMSATLEGLELFYINEDLQERIGMSKEVLTNKLSDGIQIEALMDSATKKVFVTSDEIPFSCHINMQALFQKYIDSGISKTVNCAQSSTQKDIWMAYVQAWSSGCKGITVYRKGSREKEVLVSTNGHIKDSTILDSLQMRPNVLNGSTVSIPTGHGKMYVTINGEDNKLFEVFATIGKAGACDAAFIEGIGRMISTALQYGVPFDVIAHQLRGITCCPVWNNGHQVLSPVDGIASAFVGSRNGHTTDILPPKDNTVLVCPECGQIVQIAEGCMTCLECGFSKCS